MFNAISVNCWLSYSLPVLSPKPLCQVPYHATLCCLYLADGLSRQCTGMSLCSLSPCHQSGSTLWWHAGLLPCPPLPCSAAPCSSRQHPHDSFQLFLSPRSRQTWLGGLQVLRVSPVGQRMEFSLSLPWHHNSQPQGSGMWRSARSLPSALEGQQPTQTHCGYGYCFLQWKTKKKSILSQSHSMPLCPSAKPVKKRNNTAALVTKWQVNIWALQGCFC